MAHRARGWMQVYASLGASGCLFPVRSCGVGACEMAVPVRPGPAFAPPAPGRDIWPQPDLSVLRLRRRPPPLLPLTLFGAGLGALDCQCGRGASRR